MHSPLACASFTMAAFFIFLLLLPLLFGSFFFLFKLAKELIRDSLSDELSKKASTYFLKRCSPRIFHLLASILAWALPWRASTSTYLVLSRVILRNLTYSWDGGGALYTSMATLATTTGASSSKFTSSMMDCTGWMKVNMEFGSSTTNEKFHSDIVAKFLFHVELVGLGSSSSMESFASWRSMPAEWRRKKDDWGCHFKEKMSQEQAHHHRKPWIKALRYGKMSGGRRRDEARNFMP